MNWRRHIMIDLALLALAMICVGMLVVGLGHAVAHRAPIPAESVQVDRPASP